MKDSKNLYWGCLQAGHSSEKAVGFPCTALGIHSGLEACHKGQKPVTSSSLAYLAPWPTADSYSSFEERLGTPCVCDEGWREWRAGCTGPGEEPWGKRLLSFAGPALCPLQAKWWKSTQGCSGFGGKVTNLLSIQRLWREGDKVAVHSVAFEFSVHQERTLICENRENLLWLINKWRISGPDSIKKKTEERHLTLLLDSQC